MLTEKTIQKIDSIHELLQLIFDYQKEYLTLREASTYLKLSESLLYKLKDAGKIPFYKPNGKIFFKRKELDAWIETSRVSSNQELTSMATSIF